MPLRSLFLDFNAYFASVEQQLNPALRNKPVAIVPTKADTTCCIAASYEAKKFGIKTGTIVSEAKKLCPGLKIVEANHRPYIEFHHKLVEAVGTCLPVDQVMSIDEMVCSLIGKEQKRENAIEIAKLIKKTIAEKVGEYLKCSIGIAPNRFLAKTATNMQKPDGLVIIEEKDLPHCLYGLKTGDLTGIGRRMEVRLRRHGIYTVETLCNSSKARLREIWGGIEGERMFAQLHGEIVKRPPTHRQTVGHSHVLPPKERNKDDAFGVLNRLLQKAAIRMRYLGFVTGAMSVGVKFLGHLRWREEISFNHTQNTITLLRALEKVLEHYPDFKEKPLAVGVTLFKLLDEDQNTMIFFEDYDKIKSLNKAVDGLNKKYGFSSVYYAAAHPAIKSAPMRIAFTQIPDLEIEDDEKEF